MEQTCQIIQIYTLVLSRTAAQSCFFALLLVSATIVTIIRELKYYVKTQTAFLVTKC